MKIDLNARIKRLEREARIQRLWNAAVEEIARRKAESKRRVDDWMKATVAADEDPDRHQTDSASEDTP